MAFSKTIVQRVAAASLLALAAACGGDSAPSEFDAAGTAPDVQTIDGVFASPVVAGFAAVGSSIDMAAGAPIVSASLGSLDKGRNPRSADAAASVSAVRALLARRDAAPAAGPARIPPALQGVTFVYDVETDGYVQSDRTGAPESGVRFVLYTVDPLTGGVAEPLAEVGHADLIDESTENEISARVLVESTAGVTHLDYRVTGSSSASGGEITVDGFVTDGTTRADFELENQLTADENSATLVLDYALEVPSRDISLTNHVVTTLTETTATVSYDAAFHGPNGYVDLDGEFDLDGGEFTVQVNGETFATLTMNGETGTITLVGADGQPLDAAERDALQGVFEFADDVFEVFVELLDPVIVLLGAVAA